MRVLVVGARGFIGTALCLHLESLGMEVCRLSSGEPGGIDRASGRLDTRFEVQPDTDGVIYLAQSPRWRSGVVDAPHVFAVNVMSAVEVAAAACRAGVRRFVYTSTGTVYRPAFTPLDEEAPVRRDDVYALSKLQAEEALRLFDKELEVVVTRLFGVYGPGQTGRLVPNLLAAVADGRPVRLDARADQTDDVDGLRISLLYLRDAVELLATAVSEGGLALVNLAAPEPVSIRSIATAAGRLVGRPPVFERGSTSRQGDMVADVSRMLGCWGQRHFTSLDEGMQRLCSEPA